MLFSLKKTAAFSFFIFSRLISEGQNLVPNPGFEDTSSCPTALDQIELAIGWSKPTSGTPDLFHSCNFQVPNNYFGNQSAFSGNAYAGLYTYYPLIPDGREYIQIELSDSLLTGIVYRIEFQVSLSDSSNYSTRIGAFLSDSSINVWGMNPLPFVPYIETTGSDNVSDKQNWIKVTNTFTAMGGEKYLILGNFKNDANAEASFTGNGGMAGNPDYDATYYYIDNISLYVDSLSGINNYTSSRFLIYPNPANDFVNISCDNHSNFYVEIFDMVGNLQLTKNCRGNSNVDIRNLKNGVYFLVLFNDHVHLSLVLNKI